jgi:hypothetical protein
MINIYSNKALIKEILETIADDTFIVWQMFEKFVEYRLNITDTVYIQVYQDASVDKVSLIQEFRYPDGEFESTSLSSFWVENTMVDDESKIGLAEMIMLIIEIKGEYNANY